MSEITPWVYTLLELNPDGSEKNRRDYSRFNLACTAARIRQLDHYTIIQHNVVTKVTRTARKVVPTVQTNYQEVK